MKVVRSCLIMIAWLMVTPEAYANQCSSAARSSKSSCDGAVTAAEAAGAASAMKAGKASTTNVPANAATQQSEIANQIAQIEKAKAQCQSDKSDCEQKCEQAAQQEDQKPMGMGKPMAITIRTQTKPNDCQKPIDDNIAKLEANKANLQNQSADSKGTEGSSGAMPQMPQPQDKGEETPEDKVVTLNCETDGGVGKLECDGPLLSKCTSSPASTICPSFNDYHCGLSETKYATPSGKGKGTPYCQTVVAKNFCVAGRQACLTCQNYETLKAGYSIDNTPEQVKNALNICSDDPLPYNQAAAVAGGSSVSTGYDAAVIPGTEVSTGAATGAVVQSVGSAAIFQSHSSDLKSSSANGLASQSATGDGAVAEGLGSLAASIAEQATNEAFNDRMGGDGEVTSRHPSSFRSTEVADVAAQFGGSLFNINSTTYQYMCGQRRLNCRQAAH